MLDRLAAVDPDLHAALVTFAGSVVNRRMTKGKVRTSKPPAGESNIAKPPRRRRNAVWDPADIG